MNLWKTRYKCRCEKVEDPDGMLDDVLLHQVAQG